MSHSSHRAALQALGYEYQSQWPLLELLQGSVDRPDWAITVECYDDVAWEHDGSPQALFQLKHHAGAQRGLGDKDPDWWRTIRVWMDAGDPGDLNGPTLTLVTTMTATHGTAAAALRPDPSRDPDKAQRRLEDAAQASTDATSRDTRKAFLELPATTRETFVARMYVLDKSPSISDLDSAVRHKLHHVLPRGHEDIFMSRLWHWWYERVVQLLRGQRDRLKATEVSLFIDDLRSQFAQADLPTLIPLSEINESDLEVEYADYPFVHQMRWVLVPPVFIRKGIADYYRAYEHQVRWLEDYLIGAHEIEEFECLLRDEWERQFALKAYGCDGVDETIKQQVGRELLLWALGQTVPRVRERYNDPFFSRGKYHEMANRHKRMNGIGWHPDFERRMESLLGSDAE